MLLLKIRWEKLNVLLSLGLKLFVFTSVFSGFLKGRKKKERSKKGKGKEDGEAEGKDIGSDGEERGRSETPTPDQVRKGIWIRDPDPGSGSGMNNLDHISI
jgi:hypothetical protein